MSHVNSGFRWEEDETCDPLGSYAASSRNSLPTFRHNHTLLLCLLWKTN